MLQEVVEVVAAETDLDTLIPCITQDPKEAKYDIADYLAVCTKVAALMATSIYCPPECGGHPVCRPCYALAKIKGALT